MDDLKSFINQLWSNDVLEYTDNILSVFGYKSKNGYHCVMVNPDGIFIETVFDTVDSVNDFFMETINTSKGDPEVIKQALDDFGQVNF